MLKQARTLLSSRSLCDQSHSLFQGKVKASTLRGFASWSDSSAPPGRGFSDDAKPSGGGRVFAPYAIFKGKAALTVAPVLPVFAKIDSGNVCIERRGTVMMTFMPAIGQRKYDWAKKQMFALSATEVGSVISMGSKDSSEFFHDPSMKSSNSGQVTKSLSIKPYEDSKSQDGKGGYYFSLSVQNKILKTNHYLVVPVTIAEFAVMKTAFSFALPYIMGWDRLIVQGENAPQSFSTHPKTDPLQLASEWDR
ncbi:Single-stranded DNA-binding protein WHY2 [Cardamine amara subsp. amara]|uniref:Single-stranded DNA-binding protein WHY2 n=1 Tax=Cardamine amara subsp. amara TaxID=228776 RepID=A0ABD1BGK1_CARAN